MTNVSTSTLFAVAHSIGNAQSVRLKGRPEMAFRTSSRRCRGEIGSGAIPATPTLRRNRPARAPAFDAVKPTVDVFGSVAAVTRASAADTSRAVTGRPDTDIVIEPETSSASKVRMFAGCTEPNAV